MTDEIDEPLEGEEGAEITDMEILALLLEEKGIELHTTIHNPIGMTAVDQGLAFIKQECGQEVYKFALEWTTWYRRNMVAEDGKRATGIKNAVASKIEETKRKTATEKALGDLSR